MIRFAAQRRLLAIVGLVALLPLALGCGRRQDGEAVDPCMEIPALSPDSPIASPLAASQRALAAGAAHPDADEGARVAEEIREGLIRAETRAASADRLYELWSVEPANLHLLEKAVAMASLIQRPQALAERLAHPALADSESVAGLFANAYLHRRRPESVALFQRSLNLGADEPPATRALLGLNAAEALARCGKPGEALAMLIALSRDASAAGGPALEARVWREIARTLRQMGAGDEALPAFAHAGALYHASGLEREALLARMEIALLMSGMGRSACTFKQLKAVAAEAEERGYRHLRLMCLNRLASLYEAMDEQPAALRLHKEAAAETAAAGDSITTPRALVNVAGAFMNMGQLDSAAVALAEARRWVEARPSIDNNWVVYTQESDYWMLRGDYRRADSLGRLAAETDPLTRRPEEEVKRLFSIAQLAREIGKPDVALRALRRFDALKDSIFVHMPGEDPRFDGELEMSRLRLETGEFDLARDYLELAARRLELLPASSRASRYWELRALLARSSGGLEQALAACDSALAHARISGIAGQVSRQNLALGEVLMELGRTEEALAHFRNVGRHLDDEPRYRTIQQRELMIGMASAKLGSHGEAVATFRRVLDDAGAQIARDMEPRFRIELARSLAKLDQTTEALVQLRLAARQLGESRTGESSLRFLYSDTIRDCYSLRIRLLLGHPELAGSDDVARETLLLRQEMFARIWGEKEIGGDLPPEPSLAYLLDDEESYLWRVADGQVKLYSFPGRDAVAEELRSLHRSVERPDRPLVQQTAAKLSRWLLEPLGAHWRPGETLTLLPDGPLHGLPWAMLPWRDAMVLDHGPIALGVELSRAPVCDHGETDEKLLAIGYNGEAGDGDAALLHAEAEAASVAAEWRGKSRLLLGQEARGDLLAQAAAEHYHTIHLAVHAQVHQGISDRSYLQLATAGEGSPLLAAGDVAKMGIDTDLVFLSCCEASRGAYSASGPVLDLSLAFLQGGARSVIASAFRIDDRAARKLAVRFYQHRRENADAAEALRRAQLDLRDGGAGFSHPYYWAHYHLLRRLR